MKWKEKERTHHASGKFTTEHGMTNSEEHAIWCHMRKRCLDPKDPYYPRYGGRGITLSPEWIADFANFFRDMGPRPSPKHTVDRIDNNGPYSGSNCRWATYSEQARNRSNTRWVTFNGETRCIADWAVICGISKATLWYRLTKLKWSPRKALLHRINRDEWGMSEC